MKAKGDLSKLLNYGNFCAARPPKDIRERRQEMSGQQRHQIWPGRIVPVED